MASIKVPYTGSFNTWKERKYEQPNGAHQKINFYQIETSFIEHPLILKQEWLWTDPCLTTRSRLLEFRSQRMTSSTSTTSPPSTIWWPRTAPCPWRSNLTGTRIIRTGIWIIRIGTQITCTAKGTRRRKSGHLIIRKAIKIGSFKRNDVEGSFINEVTLSECK